MLSLHTQGTLVQRSIIVNPGLNLKLAGTYFFYSKTLYLSYLTSHFTAFTKSISRQKIPGCEQSKKTSWFAIALAEIKTKRILREKADCKQSKKYRNLPRKRSDLNSNLGLILGYSTDPQPGSGLHCYLLHDATKLRTPSFT